MDYKINTKEKEENDIDLLSSQEVQGKQKSSQSTCLKKLSKPSSPEFIEACAPSSISPPLEA